MHIADKINAAKPPYKEQLRQALKILQAVKPDDAEVIAMIAEFKQKYGEL